MTLNINDKELILSILDDYEVVLLNAYDKPDAGNVPSGILSRLNRARTILERNYFREDDKVSIDSRQQELDFNDWHGHESDYHAED